MGIEVFQGGKTGEMERIFPPDGQMRLLILTYLQSTQFHGAKYVDEETTRYAVKLEAAGQSENFPPTFTNLITGLDQWNLREHSILHPVLYCNTYIVL